MNRKLFIQSVLWRNGLRAYITKAKQKITAEDLEQMKQTKDLLSALFEPAPFEESGFNKREELGRLSGQSAVNSSTSTGSNTYPVDFYRSTTKFERRALKQEFRSNALYWYCLNLSFGKSDFERILPSAVDVTFDLVRSRNPRNLTRWLGYYLVFQSNDDAMIYYNAVNGAELCGLELKLQFAGYNSPGLHSDILNKVQGLSRQNCALMIGLPQGYSKMQLRQVLWDYELIDDDNLSIEFLPRDRIKYGGQPVLLRFKNEDDPYRLVRQFHLNIFPHTTNEMHVEVVD